MCHFLGSRQTSIDSTLDSIECTQMMFVVVMMLEYLSVILWVTFEVTHFNCYLKFKIIID